MSVRHLEVPVMTGACSKSWGRNLSDTNAEERHVWVLERASMCAKCNEDVVVNLKLCHGHKFIEFPS